MLYFIQWSYKCILKPILFCFDPSRVHHWFGALGSWLGQHRLVKKMFAAFFVKSYHELEQTIDGLTYRRPGSIAAGFDKDVNLVAIMPSLGSGFHTIGSLTAKPYAGNSGPWLVRLPEDKSILVNYGLKNLGIDTHLEYLKLIQTQGLSQPLRISIAKTNCAEVCDIQEAIEDYCYSLKQLENYGLGSVYEINISCPNAFGGEDFSKPVLLNQLLSAFQELNLTKPIYLKMPADSSWEQYQNILDIALKYEISGVIVSNLTKKRKLLSDKNQQSIESISGGLSGKPCFALALERIAQTYSYVQGRMTVVGCGGVFCAQDAYDMITHGASLIQLISGLIFEGPQLFAQINQGLMLLLKKDGFSSISQAIGSKIRH